MRHRAGDEDWHYISPFRECTLNDFERKGAKIEKDDEITRKNLAHRICPDF